MGTREFSCDFFPVTQEDEDKAIELNLTYPIGSLLFDIWYDKEHNATPIYMTNAVVKNSTLVCPDELNEKMLRHLIYVQSKKTQLIAYCMILIERRNYVRRISRIRKRETKLHPALAPCQCDYDIVIDSCGNFLKLIQCDCQLVTEYIPSTAKKVKFAYCWTGQKKPYMVVMGILNQKLVKLY